MSEQLSLFDDSEFSKPARDIGEFTLKGLMAPSWLSVLEAEFSEPYIDALEAFLKEELASEQVFPDLENVFTAFGATTFEDVKVLLLGQDPYHDDGQAHGLSFSVLEGVKIPPSLRNMYKELNTDLGFPIPDHGTLTPWAEQGILMLNAVLTVQAHQAGSHKNKGWEKFTDAVIRKMNEREDPVIFLLWGGFAKKKTKLITNQQHVVIEGTHPSPLSAYNGFFGSKPYSAVNEALEKLGKDPIDWQL